VAVLVNLETTPVQLHAKPFASGDPTERGNSSYLAVPFESWLAEMIDWGRYSRIYEDDE
jgi:hypothetical protein